MTKTSKHILIGIIGFGLVTIVTICLGFDFICKYAITSLLTRRLHADVQIEAVDIDILHGVLISDVVLRRDGDLEIKIKSLRVDYQLNKLTSKEITFDRIEIDSPYIALSKLESKAVFMTCLIVANASGERALRRAA